MNPIETKTDVYGKYFDLDILGVIQRMRWVPPGTFLMGSPESEKGRYPDEFQHEVTLTKGFWLADTACTQELWEKVMDYKPSKFRGLYLYRSLYFRLYLPVETVSWDDCQRFFHRVKQLKPDLNLSLPTEDQWEYACRAGTETPFSFGDNITTDQVNYNGDYPYANGKKGQYREKTVEVKSLPCNEWGLYQMHGNVWEWCDDRFGEYPKGYNDESLRVIRGGSWVDIGPDARSAFRCYCNMYASDSYIGFRFCMNND